MERDLSIYDSNYFKLNKNYMICIGLWPFVASKTIVRSLMIFTMIASAIPHLIAILVHRTDIDRLMLSLLIFGSIMSITAKLIAMTVADSKLKELYENLANNWIIITDEAEKKILVRYAKMSRLLTLLYSSSMGSVGISLMILPLVPVVLDILYPLPTTRMRLTIAKGEYFLDRDNNFLLCYFFDAIATAAVAAVTISIDSMYVTCSLQCCALLSIVRSRLEQLRPMGSDLSSNSIAEGAGSNSNSYGYLTQTVMFHRISLNFTSILSDAYSMCFFFIFISNIMLLPLDVCAMLANMDKPYSMLIYFSFFISLLIHLFVLFWPGQQIITHGEDLYDQGYNNEWYTLPERSKQLFIIFMQRCLKPSTLTAAGLLDINFETYAAIMKSAVSYITVLASFRNVESSQ